MADGMRSLITEGTVCKVSSSMGKEYSKDKMFDGSSETCWNSKEVSFFHVILAVLDVRL